ncbi:MAG TPA: sigma-70 family RNA polymerase sigma factor, partial [Acidimicrobiia bacterium]|nr:sigma-70 family RNA polymerase sigma factor [Acidimicrobiia bacterium]
MGVVQGDAPEALLLEAVREGHTEAFLALYDRHRDLAWRIARSISVDDRDAEDAVSEAFARVLAAIPNREIGSFRSYLAVTVRHAAIDLLRSRERPVADWLEPVSTAPGPDEISLAADDDHFVTAAFRSLDERHRVALWLAEVECFTTAEVGSVVGTSPNGAAALVQRARHRLREAFLREHLRTPRDPECADTISRLAAYVRGTSSRRSVHKVDAHLAACAECRDRRAELGDVNRSLRAVIPVAPVSLLAGRRILEQPTVIAE